MAERRSETAEAHRESREPNGVDSGPQLGTGPVPVTPIRGGAAAISRLQRSSQVQFRSPEATSRFLERYPEIEPELTEAADAARGIIEPEARIAFELLTDPDEPEGRPYVFILTKLEPDEAWNRFDAFNDRWWRKRFSSVSTPIYFSVEYV